MPFLQTFARLRLTLTRPRRPLIPYLLLKGQITSQTTYTVRQILQKIPNRSKKIVLVIISQGGDVSQATIIADILKRKARQCNAQILTFAEQYALNSAFYLLCQGNRAFADRTTCIGGIQAGESKVNLGTFSQYINPLVFSQGPSYFAQRKADEPYQQQIADEMKQIYSLFSEEMKNRILARRKKIIPNPQIIDLTKFYLGEQAHKLGLIDGIGRVHQAIPKLVQNAHIELVRENKFDRYITEIKKLQRKY